MARWRIFEHRLYGLKAEARMDAPLGQAGQKTSPKLVPEDGCKVHEEENIGYITAHFLRRSADLR